MDVKDYFPYDVDPNLISVYIGRVISLDPNFSSNGILYVDIYDPDDTDLDKGAKQSNQAKASFAVRSCYNAWENPPEIKSKTQFDGAMSFTSSGDFHLRNYCFDMYTFTWIMQVSTILNIIFPVMPNVPPPMISLDTTPFPGQAVAINVSVAAKEVVNESIQSCLQNLTSSTNPSAPNIISLDEVKRLVNPTRGLLRSSNPSNDPVVKVVKAIVNPIKTIANVAIKPYLDFLECINLLLDLYATNLTTIENITFPITQFAVINDDGTATTPESLSPLAIKESLQEKINAFSTEIQNNLNTLIGDIINKIIELVYNPVASLYSMVDSKIQDIVVPIKNKIVGLIGNYVKEPLSQLTGLIAMAIQPIISSLPTIVQLIVKLALKKLLQVLLGLPIKVILGAITSAIEAVLNGAVSKIQSMISELICTSINSLINPIICDIQESFIKVIPDFNMDDIKNYLISMNKDASKFPLIYLGTDAVKPYKSFDEINWSDPSELKAMIVALIEEVKKRGSSAPIIPSGVTVTENKTEIYRVGNEPQGANQKSLAAITVTTGSETPSSIPVDGDLKEGTLSDKSELFYQKFSSKEEFMPYFEQVHEPITEKAEIGKESTIFEKSVPEVWITNGVAYLDVQDGDTKLRYVTYYNKDGQTIGVQTVVCSDGSTKTLTPNAVYYSTTIPHVKKNENDPPVGEDLVPVVENGELKQVSVPVTVKDSDVREDADLGDPLYKDIDGSSKTFKELTKKYYQVIVPRTIDLNEFSKNIIDVLNNSGQPLDTYPTGALNVIFRSTEFSKCMRKSGNYSYSIVEEQIVDDSVNPPVKERVLRSEIPSIANSNFSTSRTDGEVGQKILKFTLSVGQSPLTIGSSLLIEIEGIVDTSTHKLTTCEFKTLKMPIPSSPLPVNPSYNNVILTGTVKEADSTSTEYYCWMTSKIETREVQSTEINNTRNTDSITEQMSNMFVHTVQAMGQDEGFNAKALFNAVTGKAVSEVGKVADVISGVDSVISSTLERVDDLKKVDAFIDKISEVGSKIKDIADTAGPALEATAKAASALAIQSCSMSQSASGKDFSFNSGSNYDLLTTTEARSQLPWCKELNREQFLEPNCKVLLMAVGAGKSNLYVIDILT